MNATLPSPRASQRKLVLDDPSLCTLLDIGAARAALPGHDEDDILALVKDGLIEAAFDIGLQSKTDLRLLRSCLEHYKQTRGDGKKKLNWDWKRIAAEILSAKPSTLNLQPQTHLLGTRAKLILNCGSGHIINLIEADELAVVKGTSWNTGPAGSPQITLASFLEFLKRRRIKA